MLVSEKVEQILREVDALGADERNALMRALDLADGAAIRSEWSEEIESRVMDIDEGRTPLISHQEVVQRFRKDIENLKSRKRA